MRDQLTETVLSVVASVKHLPQERISLESSLEDLGFDSLDKVTMLFDLEKQCQISIPDEAVGSIRIVRDIVEGVAKLTAAASLDSATPDVQP